MSLPRCNHKNLKELETDGGGEVGKQSQRKMCVLKTNNVMFLTLLLSNYHYHLKAVIKQSISP